MKTEIPLYIRYVVFALFNPGRSHREVMKGIGYAEPRKHVPFESWLFEKGLIFYGAHFKTKDYCGIYVNQDAFSAFVADFVSKRGSDEKRNAGTNVILDFLGAALAAM